MSVIMRKQPPPLHAQKDANNKQIVWGRAPRPSKLA